VSGIAWYRKKSRIESAREVAFSEPRQPFFVPLYTYHNSSSKRKVDIDYLEANSERLRVVGTEIVIPIL